MKSIKNIIKAIPIAIIIKDISNKILSPSLAL